MPIFEGSLIRSMIFGKLLLFVIETGAVVAPRPDGSLFHTMGTLSSILLLKKDEGQTVHKRNNLPECRRP
jgi:hypothetical protein